MVDVGVQLLPVLVLVVVVVLWVEVLFDSFLFVPHSCVSRVISVKAWKKRRNTDDAVQRVGYSQTADVAAILVRH